MYIAQIAEVRLKAIAARQLTKDAYDAAERWLGQWTPKGNFEAVVAKDRQTAVEVLAAERLVPPWLAGRGVHRRHFSFQINGQEVKNGRFWMPNGLRLCVDYDFTPEEPA